MLLLVGVLLAHVSVNLFNEFSDHQTGIDSHTRRTPFSGGSGLLQSGKTRPVAVKRVAYGTFFLAAGIGVYFFFASGWLILPLMVIGGLVIRFYTSHLTRWLLGEFAAGATLGSCVVLGCYYALTRHVSIEAFLLSLPAGLLTMILLFLNEFPDVEADQKGGRRHWVIFLGRKKSAALYACLMAAVYGCILLGPFVSTIPKTVLIALVTLPPAVMAVRHVLKNHDHPERLVPALGMNVAVVLLTDLLLAVGMWIA